MTRKRISRIFIIAAFLCFTCSSALAESMMDNPLTPPDTSSPQSTLNSYLTNMTKCYKLLQKAFLLDLESPNLFMHTPEVERMHEEATLHFQKAIDCLDLSEVPAVYRDEYSKEVVIQLKEILDRIHLPRMSLVPSMDENQKELTLWRIPKTPIELVLMKEGVRSGEFLFSAETVANIPELYEMAKRLPYLTQTTRDFFKFYISTPGSLLPPKWFHYLPAWMSSEVYYSETIFQWTMLVLSLIFLLTFISFVYRYCSRNIDSADHPIRSDLFKLTLPVLLALVTYFLMYFLEGVVNLSGDTLHYTTGVLDVVKWLAAAWATVVAGSLVANIFIASPNVNPQSIDASLIRTIAYLGSIFLSVCVLFYGGSNLGLPLIPIVTGFGVIGLAVSLAAKPTIENIIGGLTLFADRPVRIGEYCAFDDQWGKVLHIGLRSTRIRAGDRTVISVPNALFSQMKLVNLNDRDIYRFSERLQLRQETTGAQIRWIMAKCREVLVAHPKVLSKYLFRVKLDALNTYSKTLRVYTFIDGTLGWEAYLEARQDLLFRINEIITEAGTGLALPSQTIYFSKDVPPVTTPAHVMADLAADEHEYPYPGTTDERYDELVDRLRYPPEEETDFGKMVLLSDEEVEARTQAEKEAQEEKEREREEEKKREEERKKRRKRGEEVEEDEGNKKVTGAKKDSYRVFRR